MMLKRSFRNTKTQIDETTDPDGISAEDKMTLFVPIKNTGEIIGYFVVNQFTGYEATVSVEVANLIRAIEEKRAKGEDSVEEAEELLELNKDAYWDFVD